MFARVIVIVPRSRNLERMLIGGHFGDVHSRRTPCQAAWACRPLLTSHSQSSWSGKSWPSSTPALESCASIAHLVFGPRHQEAARAATNKNFSAKTCQKPFPGKRIRRAQWGVYVL
jgi:hypothetical protein